MNFRQKRWDDPEISLAGLIDVVFLLLIFFMVSTSFTHQSEITVDLPEASAAPVERDTKPIEIVIDTEGRFYVNQKLIVNKQQETLVKAIERIQADSQENVADSIIISADANTPHQAVVTAMDAARQAGIFKVSLATKQVGGGN
jgi:biopolymer transport protein ExbD